MNSLWMMRWGWWDHAHPVVMKRWSFRFFRSLLSNSCETDIPSGKRLYSYGKSPCYSEGKTHEINGDFLHSYVSLPEGSGSLSSLELPHCPGSRSHYIASTQRMLSLDVTGTRPLGHGTTETSGTTICPISSLGPILNGWTCGVQKWDYMISSKMGLHG